MNDALFMLVI